MTGRGECEGPGVTLDPRRNVSVEQLPLIISEELGGLTHVWEEEVRV